MKVASVEAFSFPSRCKSVANLQHSHTVAAVACQGCRAVCVGRHAVWWGTWVYCIRHKERLWGCCEAAGHSEGNTLRRKPELSPPFRHCSITM